MSIFGKTRSKQFQDFNKAYLFYKVSFFRYVSENAEEFTDTIEKGDFNIFAVRCTDYLLGEEINMVDESLDNPNVVRALDILPLIYEEAESMYEIEDVQAMLLPLLEWKYIRLGKLMGDEFIDSKEGQVVKNRIDVTPAYIRDTDNYKSTLLEMSNVYKDIIL